MRGAVDQGVVGVVEGASDVEGHGGLGRQAHLAAEAGGDRGAGQHRGPAFPERAAQEAADVDRCQPQRRRALAALDPHHLRVGRLAQRVEVVHQGARGLLRPQGPGRSVLRNAVGQAAQRGLGAGHPLAHRGEGGRQVVGQRQHETVAQVWCERVGQQPAGRVDVGDRGAGLGEDAAQQPAQVSESTRPDLDSAGGRDHVVEDVGLVDDRQVVLREDGAGRGDVEPVEVEVDDDHVGFGGGRACLLGEACVAARAAPCARTVARRGADGHPGGVGGLGLQLGSVADPRGRGPRHHGGELLRIGALRQAVERQLRRRLPRAAARHLGKPLGAEVVGAALQHRPVERTVEVLLQEGQVLGGQLVLQCLRGRRDDDPLAREDGRHQVTQGLAGARAGPHDDVLVAVDRLGDPFGHLHLALAGLTTAGELCHDPAQLAGDVDRADVRHSHRI